MPTFGFRIKFILPEDKRINCSQNSIKIELPSKHKIQLSAYQSNIAIKNSKNLILKGSGFKTKEEARNIGEKLKNSIMLTSAILQIGIDVGKDKTNFSISKFLKNKAMKSGFRFIEDIHGLHVYQEGTPIQWVSSELTNTIIISNDKFINALQDAFNLVPDKLEEKRYLSLELYSASHFESSLRAKFLILVSVVECLAARDEKSGDVIAFIEELINYTKTNYKESGKEKSNLISRLGNLKRNSISVSCNKLVEYYLGEESMKYFSYCYDIRSKILHDGNPPASTDLGVELPKLDKLASRLIFKIISKQGDE